MQIGVDPRDWLHKPDQVVSGIWELFLTKRGIAIPTFAKELAPRLANNNVVIEDKTVEDNLYRWKKTDKMNVRSILQLLEAGYEALAIALLYGNAFQKFWGTVRNCTSLCSRYVITHGNNARTSNQTHVRKMRRTVWLGREDSRSHLRFGSVGIQTIPLLCVANC